MAKPEAKQSSEDGFFAKLFTKVADNIQVYIDNVHIRYEDRLQKIPSVIGITLDSLHVQSATDNWELGFISERRKVFNKVLSIVCTDYQVVELQNLSIYYNTGSALHLFDVEKVRDNPSQFIKAMENLVFVIGLIIRYQKKEEK